MLRASAEEAQRLFESKEASYRARMQVVEDQRDEIQKQFRDYQAEADARLKHMNERYDEKERTMHAERMRLEAQLSQSRSDAERLRIERDQKATQLEVMGQTMDSAAKEQSKSLRNIESLQMSLNQCAKDKQAWQQEESGLKHVVKTKDFKISELEGVHTMERNNWQQERHRLMADIDSLSCQIKQRMQISAEQQNTIEHYKRMEIQWGLEKTSLEQAEASVRAQLAQTEEDLGYQIQAQEKSIQHAKETLGQTENTLNNRLLLLEKELTASQAATMAQEREVTRLKRELADRENVIAQLRSALDARREAELRLEKQVAAERMQRDQQYREMQDTQAKTEHRHSQALAGLQDEIDKARQEWELERHRIYTRVEEERLNWDRKEANYVSNLEKAEREAEAAASSLQVCSLVCVCVCVCVCAAGCGRRQSVSSTGTAIDRQRHHLGL